MLILHLHIAKIILVYLFFHNRGFTEMNKIPVCLLQWLTQLPVNGKFAVLFGYAIILTVASPSLAQDPKLRIAVLEFNTKDVRLSEASIITERFRSGLDSSGYFQVMERIQMNQILKEKSFKQIDCASLECAIDIGPILSIKMIAVGALEKKDNSYNISVTILDVETGEIITTESQNCIGLISRVLEDSNQKLVEKTIAALQNKNILQIKEMANLRLESEPNGAEIYINGVQQKGLTPKTFRFPAGLYRMEVSKETFFAETTFTTTKYESTFIKLYLTNGIGGLDITLNPNKALLILDGREIGSAPLICNNLPAGEHLLTVDLVGYALHRQRLFIRPKQVRQVKINLLPACSLQVDCPLPGSIVFLDSFEIGVTPLIFNRAAPGKQLVTVTNPLGGSWSKKFDLVSKQCTRVNAELLHKKGLVTFISQPAGASIRMDNHLLVGETPLTQAGIPFGKYKVVFSKKGFDPVAKEASLFSEDTILVMADLTPFYYGKLEIRGNVAASISLDDTLVGVLQHRMNEINVKGGAVGENVVNDTTNDYYYRLDWIRAGSYQITAQYPAYSTIKKNIIVKKDTENEIGIIMQMSEAVKVYQDKLRFHELRHSRKKVVCTILAIAGLGAGGFAVFNHEQAARTYDDYSKHGSNQTELDADWDSYQSQLNNFNLGIWVSGGALALASLYFVFPNPKPEKPAELKDGDKSHFTDENSSEATWTRLENSIK